MEVNNQQQYWKTAAEFVIEFIEKNQFVTAEMLYKALGNSGKVAVLSSETVHKIVDDILESFTKVNMLIRDEDHYIKNDEAAQRLYQTYRGSIQIEMKNMENNSRRKPNAKGSKKK